MNIDGSDDQELVSGTRMYPFFINAGQIYFLMQESDDEPANLYRMNLNGYEQSKLLDNVTRAIAIDDWIYYVSDYGKQLNKMSADGSVIIPLYTSDHWITTLHYRQGWIYMMNGTFGIHSSAYMDKLRIDGTGLTGLGEARSAALYFVDQSLYLSQNSWQSSNTLVRMDVD
ncbi:MULTISPECIES: DUF5050 domain-containing protein [unclassified Paenibacillus]|uniref:DUF5050 domain-containing protein n=1 Tax=unclassified Paenibacillus TaxID=185978 RepID=UPI00363C92BF